MVLTLASFILKWWEIAAVDHSLWYISGNLALSCNVMTASALQLATGGNYEIIAEVQCMPQLILCSYDFILNLYVCISLSGTLCGLCLHKF